MNNLWTHTFPTAVLAIGLSLALSGCGQKGALYLPQEQPQITPKVVAVPAQKEKEESKKGKSKKPYSSSDI